MNALAINIRWKKYDHKNKVKIFVFTPYQTIRCFSQQKKIDFSRLCK